MFLAFRVIDDEYIEKISRGILKHVYRLTQRGETDEGEKNIMFESTLEGLRITFCNCDRMLS